MLLDFFVSAPGLGPDGRPLDPADLDRFVVGFGGAEQVFHHGPASVATPGMIHGLAEANRRFGQLTLAELVEPAIALARSGVIISPQAGYLHGILGDMLTATPAAAAIYAPEGRLLRAGDRLAMPELAESLAEIGRLGAGAMAEDSLGGEIRRHLARTSGRITAADLERFAVIERAPLRVRYRDCEVVTNPPPSSGGVLIAASLLTLAGRPAPADEVAFYLAAVAAGQAANALRDEAFSDLLREPDAATGLLARLGRDDGDGSGTSRSPFGSTTHISAIDADGGVAALSSSNGAGSGVVVPGTGILLNNMMGEQDLNPHGFGRIPAGDRLPSMMAPTLIARARRPLLAVGSAGSNRLRSAILQAVMSVIDQDLDPPAAVARARVHPEAGAVDVEAGVPAAAIAALAAEGHVLRRWGAMNLFFGGVNLVRAEPGGPTAAGDPRRGGAAAIVTAAGEIVMT